MSDLNGNSALGFIISCLLSFASSQIIALVDREKYLDENLYETIEKAAIAWGNEYYPKTIADHKERGAIIQSKTIDEKKYYYIGKTRKGFKSTCWNAFVLGLLFSSGKVEGFIHSHTAYYKDGLWDSIDYGPSDTDEILFYVPGISRQFIANEAGQIYEFYKDGSQKLLQ